MGKPQIAVDMIIVTAIRGTRSDDLRVTVINYLPSGDKHFETLMGQKFEKE